MTGKELIVCITLVVIICFIIAALLGTLRECIVLRHGEQRKEADDGQKERNEKI